MPSTKSSSTGFILNAWASDQFLELKVNPIREDSGDSICFSADIWSPLRILNILEKIGDKIVACKLHIDIINIECT